MRPKLLIIDDDQTLLDALETVLKAVGYDVVSGPSGEAGLKLLSGMPVDLVLLDLRLPGTQGHEVLQKIRATSLTLPVIIMTAYCQEEARQEIERLGVIAIICKPFARETLLNLIDDALANAQGR